VKKKLDNEVEVLFSETLCLVSHQITNVAAILFQASSLTSISEKVIGG
jgi:hypothetical protein